MLNGLHFTPRLRRVLQASREEARRLHHEYVGAEHLLLGLLREEDSVTAAVLRHLDIAPQKIRQKLEEVVVPGNAADTTGPDLPYTSRGKRVLELTLEEAMRSRAEAADTVHLLLGLCAEEKGIAAQVLAWAGLTTDLARAEVERLTAAESESTLAPAHAAGVVSVGVELRLADGTTTRAEFQSVAAAMEFLLGQR
jgi:ATP-dependent Clp protease ATP-binding subunit ClpC